MSKLKRSLTWFLLLKIGAVTYNNNNTAINHNSKELQSLCLKNEPESPVNTATLHNA